MYLEKTVCKRCTYGNFMGDMRQYFKEESFYYKKQNYPDIRLSLRCAYFVV